MANLRELIVNLRRAIVNGLRLPAYGRLVWPDSLHNDRSIAPQSRRLRFDISQRLEIISNRWPLRLHDLKYQCSAACEVVSGGCREPADESQTIGADANRGIRREDSRQS